MIEVDLNELETRMRRLAIENPCKSVRCFYAHYAKVDDIHADPEPDGPGCIVGTALFEMGIGLNVLMELDDKDYTTVDTIIEGLTDFSWITQAQMHQDSGHSWGEAVRLADGASNTDELDNDDERA